MFFRTQKGVIIATDPAEKKSLKIIKGDKEIKLTPHDIDESWFISTIASDYKDEDILITAGGGDKTCKIWNIEGKLLHEFKNGKKITSLCVLNSKIGGKDI